MSTITKPPSISAADWNLMSDAQKKAVVYERTTTGTDEKGKYTQRDTRQLDKDTSVKQVTTKRNKTWKDRENELRKDGKNDTEIKTIIAGERKWREDNPDVKNIGVEETKSVETDNSSVSAWNKGEKVYKPKTPGGNVQTKVTEEVVGEAGSKVGKAVGAAAESDPGAFGQIAKGLAKTGGSLVGGGKRRREQRAADKEFKQRKQAYEDFEMENVWADASNAYEDLKVNTQEAEFNAQQSQQGLSNALGALSTTAGGSGIAALAQTMVGQQAMNIQRAGGSIGMQESRNEALRAQGEERRQDKIMGGASEVQQFELGRTETLFDMASTRKKEADDARKKATQDLVGGIADTVVGVGRVVAAVYTGGASEAAVAAGKQYSSAVNSTATKLKKGHKLEDAMNQKRAVQAAQQWDLNYK